LKLPTLSRPSLVCALTLICVGGLLIPMGGPASAQSSSKGATSMWSFLAEGNFQPIIEGTYGYGIIDHKSFSADLPVAGVAGIKFGFREVKLFKDWGKKLDERFFLGGYATSTAPIGKPGTGDLEGEWWRVGLGQRAGYGWQLGRQALIPYHQYSFNYGEMTFKNMASLSPADTALLSRVMGEGRLSMSTEAGLTLNLFSSLSASAGYEASVVYSRLIFPQWITSYLLLGSSVAVMSTFAEEIVSSSPFLGPILYFVLRNGVAYAFFYAFRSQMNWPFASEAPFMTHTFKIDLSLEF
jgi:hypothetical protein